MSTKGEARFLEKWMQKGKGLGKEPPRPDEARYNLEEPELNRVGPEQVEQLNMKVPKGTKLRLKRLAIDQGGVSMLTIFKRMLNEYEARHKAKEK